MIYPISNIENNIRISATSTFNAQDAYENAFDDLFIEKTTEEEQTKNPKTQVFYNLGMPPGLNLDTSYIDELEASSYKQ